MPITTETSGRAILDRIIKEATEQNQLKGLVIRIPANRAGELVPDYRTNGRDCNGVIAVYRGVAVRETARIQSFAAVEVCYDKASTKTAVIDDLNAIDAAGK
jgi:hypothetical protein